MIEGWSSDTTPIAMNTSRLLLSLILCACPASSTEPTETTSPTIADSDSSGTTSPDTTDSPMPTTTEPDSTGEPGTGTSGTSSETGDPPADTTSSGSGDSDTGEPPPPPALFLCCAGTNVQCSQGDQMCTQFGYCPYDCDITVTDSCGDPAWATCQVVNGLSICVKTTPSDCLPSASGDETTGPDGGAETTSGETASSETTSDESTSTSTGDQPTGEG